jgi:hypothetical protein
VLSNVMSWSMNCPMNVEPRKQTRGGVEMGVVRYGLVLDHRFRQADQQVVPRREGRKPLEHRPEPALGQPVLAREVHASQRDAVQATGSFGGVRDDGRPADHRAGRQAGHPSEEPAAGKATVVPARPNLAIVSVHCSVSSRVDRAITKR